MRKDIFIDNNIASKFSNPQDPEYIKLTKWLMFFDSKEAADSENSKDNFAHLVVSQKLLIEYFKSSKGATSSSSIPVIIDKLTREGRLIKFSIDEINDFKQAYFSKKVIKNFESNHQDWELLPIIFLSDRKFALSYDDKFTKDIENFPKFTATVAKRPEDLPYNE